MNAAFLRTADLVASAASLAISGMSAQAASVPRQQATVVVQATVPLICDATILKQELNVNGNFVLNLHFRQRCNAPHKIIAYYDTNQLGSTDLDIHLNGETPIQQTSSMALFSSRGSFDGPRLLQIKSKAGTSSARTRFAATVRIVVTPG